MTAHAGAMFAVLQDPAIYVHENDPPASIEWLTERFRRLESRSSADGRELWLNWVLRHPTRGLIGFVQATVRGDASADIAYVLGSRSWGQGLASEAVQAMLGELAEYYNVRTLSAVLKRANVRSIWGFSSALGSRSPPATLPCVDPIESDEVLMEREMSEEWSSASEAQNAALACRWFDEVWNERRDETVHELLASRCGRTPRRPRDAGRVRLLQGARLPDRRVPRLQRFGAEEVIAQGDHVAARWSVQATHSGDLLGIPATGMPVAFRGMTWLCFSSGRIAEGWDAWNQGTLMMDLQAVAREQPTDPPDSRFGGFMTSDETNSANSSQRGSTHRRSATRKPC